MIAVRITLPVVHDYLDVAQKIPISSVEINKLIPGNGGSMFDGILLPLDGSELAEISIPYGEELATDFGSELILYHSRVPGPDELEHIHEGYLDRLVGGIRQNIQGSNAKVSLKIQAEEPADNICNVVSKNNIDLIIMASVSASDIKIGKMLGSVTDHVCHTVPIPVLLIRPQVNLKIKNKQKLFTKLLVPLDGSDLSKKALPVAEKLSSALKVPVTIFEMATMLHQYIAYGYGPIIDYAKMDAAEKKEVEEEMRVLNEAIRQKGIDVNSIVTLGSDAAIEIEKVTETIGADLIIMTTHGRSGLDRWLMGSVTEKVLRYGKVPLLLVNARAA
jgi:nucleotide-binding universal stress UspA family protein